MPRITEIERNLSALESNFISSQPNMNTAATEVIGEIDDEMHHVGSKWSPFFGRFVFLSQSISYIGYDLVYELSDHEHAKNIISMWSQLTEQAGYLNSDFNFTDFLNFNVEMNAMNLA